MNFLNEFFGYPVVNSLSWTLLHSLWYGAIIAFLTLLILFFLKNQSSNTRYRVSIISMFSIVALSIWTFLSYYKYYTQLSTAENQLLQSSTNTDWQNILGLFWLKLLPHQFSETLNYFTVHFPIIFTVWLITVLFLSIRYLGGYVYSQRLKHYRIKEVNDFWQNKLNDLSALLNIKKKVRLLESAIVKVPMIIGHLKPVILIPIGLLTCIPNEQIEAILIHELAHILRRDYLVKLLQTIVEILFFFNPFVWWISSVINKERENSCDDLAISITKDSISFVRALVGLCELEVKNSGFALAFGRSNNQIIKRMERIMKKNESKNNFSQFTTALIILFSSIVLLGTSNINSGNNEEKQQVFKKNESFVNNAKVQEITNKQEDDKKKELQKIEESLKKLKKVHSSEKDPEKKKELKKKLDDLEKKAWTLYKEVHAKDNSTKKEDMKEIKNAMKKLKAAYETESNPDKKKKYKQKIIELDKKAKMLQKENKQEKVSKVEKVSKKELQKKIVYLEEELAKTNDEAKKKEIKKKIWTLKEKADDVPPPPPPPLK